MLMLEQSYNFRAISPTTTTSGKIEQQALDGLAEYTSWINLLPDDNADALANEQYLVEAVGASYIYLPVDFNAPTLQNWLDFAEAMAAAEQRAGKIHAHCAANYRVSAFMSRYYLQTHRWTSDEADAFIQSLWPIENCPQWVDLLADIDHYIGQG